MADAVPTPAPSAMLVTGNPGKLEEARRLCSWDLQAVSVDLPEIQSLDLIQVLRQKGEEAWRRLERPLIVEETGLELEALNGFPGPLVKWMLQAIGAEGIARLANREGKPGAQARCALLYRTAEVTLLAEGCTRGKLLLPPRGEGGFGWDSVFAPEEQSRTYAELPADEKDRLSHRGRAWRALDRQLRQLREQQPA